MTDPHQPLDADAWARRLGQTFQVNAAKALGDFLEMPVVRLDATVTPDRLYDPRLLTFRGQISAVVQRTCVVSLEDFEETVEGVFERSYALSASAPGVPEGAEEAEPFPPSGVTLIDMIGDEVALSLSPFPRAPGATLPESAQEPASAADARPNPFAALAALKKDMSPKA